MRAPVSMLEPVGTAFAELAEALHRVVRRMSSIRFGQLGSIDGVLVGDHVGPCDRAYDHWIARTTLTAPWVHLAFEAHFSSAEARRLASALTGSQQHDPVTCQSAVAEFSNLVMGTLGRAFGIAMTNSLGGDESLRAMVPVVDLPSIAPSYDRCTETPVRSPRVSAWRIVWLGGEITCTSAVELQPGALQAVAQVPLVGVLAMVSDLDGVVVADRSEHEFG